MEERISPDSAIQESMSLIDRSTLVSLFRHPAIFVWTFLTIVLGITMILLGIPMPSSYAVHLPIIYLPLLVIIPIIILHTGEQSQRNLPVFKYWQVIILLIVGSLTLMIAASTFYQALNNEFILLFTIPFLMATIVFKIHMKDLGFRGNVKDLIFSVSFGLIYCALVFFLVGINELVAFGGLIYFLMELDTIINALPFAVSVCLIAIALPEEFLFRSVLQSKCETRYGTITGILLASLIFGLFHVPANYFLFTMFGYDFVSACLAAIAIAFIAQAQVGIILGVAWHRTKSLLLPIALHTGHNVAEMLPVFIFLMLT